MRSSILREICRLVKLNNIQIQGSHALILGTLSLIKMIWSLQIMTMQYIANNFGKILFGGAFILGGINFPIITTGIFLECQPESSPNNKNQHMVSCEVSEKRGGTLFTGGTQVLDRNLFQHIRHAEVATLKDNLIESGRRSPPERLVFVLAKGKETVNSPLNPGIANSLSNQVNSLISDPTAQRFSIEISQSTFIPQVIGCLLVAGGVLVFFTKPS